MRQVLRYIEQRTAQQEDGPFIAWLSDESVPPRDRLMRWLPCAAPWVFGFKDLNGILLRYPAEDAALDPYKKAINDHLDEDAQHWSFYLEDLRRLGLDVPVGFPDVLQFLWGDETLSQRVAMYELSVLANRAVDPVLRYGLIATIESMAHLLFTTLQRVSARFHGESEGGGGADQLQYVGAVHADKEPGHLMNQEGDAEAGLRDVVLEGWRRDEALEIVSRVSDLIQARWDELYRCGQSDRFLTFLRTA
jgi:hypothetical protein